MPGGRSRNTTNYYGEGPSGAYANSTGVFTESGGWSDAANGQPSDDERTGGKERPDENLNDGVQRHRTPKTQVSHVALQTDTCDTLDVMKKHFDRVHYCYCSKFTSAAIRPNAHSFANSEKPSISGNSSQG